MRRGIQSLVILVMMWLPAQAGAQFNPNVKLRINLAKDMGSEGILTGGNYTLVFRINVNEAVGFADDLGPEALVVDDPDECLDLSHFSSLGPFEPSCPGGPDESFIPFNSEATDQPNQFDFCASSIRDRLVDDIWDPTNIMNLNKPYLIAGNDSGGGGNTDGILTLRPVGVFTGGDALSTFDFEDCYGLSADDDIPGLVLMADIGPLRVFDENFNRVGSRIRNFAGMLNSVTIELRGKYGRSGIVGFMRVPDGLLEPLTLVDLSTDNVSDPNVDFLTRRDSGPVESHQFPFDPTTATQAERTRAILDTFPDIDFTLRAVLVDGPAPEFIDDIDGNGIFDRWDLFLAGYPVLSTQDSFRIRAIQNDVLSENPEFECPAAILAGDLDGDGSSGYSCNTGSARSIRRRPK